MIYFVHNPSERAIKVGYSSDPWKRLGGLQTGSPSAAYILGVIEGDRHNETAWKRFFRPVRIRGEWFKERPVLAYFREHLIEKAIVRLREIDWDGVIRPYIKPVTQLTPDEGILCLSLMERSTPKPGCAVPMYCELLVRVHGDRFERRFAFMDDGESMN